jgi:REP element-mobilizing transposase RayT
MVFFVWVRPGEAGGQQMPQSFASLNEHIIFSTKHRQRLIAPAIEDRLYGIAGGAMHSVRGCRLAAGGTADHVHLLVSRPRDLSTSDVVRDIKVATSRWMHDEINIPQFAWQTGYGAFSVSYSGIDAVRVTSRVRSSITST